MSRPANLERLIRKDEISLQDQQAAVKGTPLDSPVIKALRDFTTQAAQARAVAVVVVSMSQSGNIGMAAVTPGGYVQGYGLLQQAIILMQGQQAQQQGPR